MTRGSPAAEEVKSGACRFPAAHPPPKRTDPLELRGKKSTTRWLMKHRPENIGTRAGAFFQWGYAWL